MTPLEANRRLATALGWTNIVAVGGALLGTPPAGQPECRGQAAVPKWSGDWRHCGPLMVKYDVMRMISPRRDEVLARSEVVRMVTAFIEIDAKYHR
jgi:hypothetical protein